MTILSKGGNCALATTGPIKVAIGAGRTPSPADIACFMVGADGRVASDDYMIFYNQPKSPDGSVRLDARTAQQTCFTVDTAKLPATVQKCFFTLTLDGGEVVSKADGLRLSVDGAGPTITYAVTEIGSERALIVAELYRHGGGWKLRAVGQGFDGGLAPLARHFGVDVEDDVPETKAVPPPPPPPAPPVKAAPISLAKKGESGVVDLRKDTPVTAHLRWTTRGDLDLYCLWVDKDGRCGTTYYRDLGSSGKFPHVQLKGDSKTPGEETVVIHKPEALRFALIAAYSAVSNGTGSFKSFGAHAVVDNGAGSPVTAKLSEKSSFSYWAAIALVDFTTPGKALVRQVEQYGKRFSESAPELHADGRVTMSTGKIEFKDN
jgi:stress response protein SCP2